MLLPLMRHGSEPWRINGASMHMLADVAPGIQGSLGYTEPRFQHHTFEILGRLQPIFAPGWLEYSGRLWFNASDALHGNEVFSLPLTAQPTLDVAAGQTVGLSTAGVPLAIASAGTMPVSGPLTLTLTLPPGVTYTGDTSAIMPTLDGATVTWVFAELPPPFTVNLAIAEANPADYPLVWQLKYAGTSVETTTMLHTRFQVWTPLLRR